MTKAHLIPFLLLPFFAASAAQAEVNLIAIGEVNANYQDLSPRTASPLENGVAGNILGGVGSGLAYAGGNTFVATPDRGPNANPYNPLVDDTTSYINRFQTFNLALAANPGYDSLAIGSLPYILSPFLADTTLLSSTVQLSYGVDGAPALNGIGKYYFTGRSDNFNASKGSSYRNNGRLDLEAIRVSADGKSVFISDEYGPYVYQFSRTTGKRMKVFTLPAHFNVANLRAVEAGTDGEIAVNTSGRTTNKGMEGLAITPDGKTLVGIMQANLIQDTKKYIRIVTIDIATGTTKEYAYLLTDGTGASEIVAINDHEFLVDERDGKGLGDNSAAVAKKLFKIDLAGATDVSNLAKLDATSPVVIKTLFLDVVAELAAMGINANDIPAKIEAVAFGPDRVIGGVTKHTLFIANDNDFLATITDSNHPNGIANPNKFFVFSVDGSDLPNYVPQTIAPLANDNHDHG
ncbi:MAG: esterase-like activity of phytase family protein [Methylovulum sp.]|nr:esterase-like activity of phytase family protein [Methylovulum sp.]